MDRQHEILEAFKKSDKTVLTKKEIINLGEIGYYCNTSKHAGETLSRMVKNGLLVRVKKGHYRLSGRKNRFPQHKVDNNQLKML